MNATYPHETSWDSTSTKPFVPRPIVPAQAPQPNIPELRPAPPGMYTGPRRPAYRGPTNPLNSVSYNRPQTPGEQRFTQGLGAVPADMVHLGRAAYDDPLGTAKAVGKGLVDPETYKQMYREMTGQEGAQGLGTSSAMFFTPFGLRAKGWKQPDPEMPGNLEALENGSIVYRDGTNMDGPWEGDVVFSDAHNSYKTFGDNQRADYFFDDVDAAKATVPEGYAPTAPKPPEMPPELLQDLLDKLPENQKKVPDEINVDAGDVDNMITALHKLLAEDGPEMQENFMMLYDNLPTKEHSQKLAVFFKEQFPQDFDKFMSSKDLPPLKDVLAEKPFPDPTSHKRPVPFGEFDVEPVIREPRPTEPPFPDIDDPKYKGPNDPYTLDEILDDRFKQEPATPQELIDQNFQYNNWVDEAYYQGVDGFNNRVMNPSDTPTPPPPVNYDDILKRLRQHNINKRWDIDFDNP